MGLPSMRTSPSESPPSLRKGNFVRFSFSSISMRESRLCRSASRVGVLGEGEGQEVGVAGRASSGIGGGSG